MEQCDNAIMELMDPDRSSDDDEQGKAMMTQHAMKGVTSQTTTQVMEDGWTNYWQVKMMRPITILSTRASWPRMKRCYKVMRPGGRMGTLRTPVRALTSVTQS